MPPDLNNDQELVLKKRARRRLVGAIALVLLMVIILPRILQDRATLAPQEIVKISMPVAHDAKLTQAVAASVNTVVPELKNVESHSTNLAVSNDVIIPEAPSVAETLVASNTQAALIATNADKLSPAKNITENVNKAQKVDIKSEEVKKNVTKISEPKPVKEGLAEVKVTVAKIQESKPLESKPLESKIAVAKFIDPKSTETQAQKHDGTFTIQVGVFSELANVKQLQAKLKKAGLASRTETINTAKGDKIRLKVGNFKSRQDAISALSKLKTESLSGMVISND